MNCIVFKKGIPEIMTVIEAHSLKITPIYIGEYSNCEKYLKIIKYS